MEPVGRVHNWGRWGTGDERGTLNLVTPGVVRTAAAAVKTGKVYSLAVPISRTKTPAVWDRPPPERYTRSAPSDELLAVPAGSASPDAPITGSADDMLVLSSHAGTHLDALCHVFEGEGFFNGHPVSSFSTRRGATKCAITATGTVATRGVMLDVAGEAPLEGGHVITPAELEACCERQGVEVCAGDAVFIRTGWLEASTADRGMTSWPQAGIGIEAAAWLASRDVALVAADNSAVEVIPFDSGRNLAVHVELIVHAGIALLEHAWLAELAADSCHVFLLVVGALPVVGATGSPVNPIAIG